MRVAAGLGAFVGDNIAYWIGRAAGRPLVERVLRGNTEQLDNVQEQFHKRVTMGSFPLHPLTTALLCNIELLESANPRSVLGFVFEELSRRADLPVVSHERPAWVDAVTLVDQFGQITTTVMQGKFFCNPVEKTVEGNLLTDYGRYWVQRLPEDLPVPEAIATAAG